MGFGKGAFQWPLFRETGPMPARTTVDVLEHLWHPVGALSRVVVEITTGRKHQIRSGSWSGHVTCALFPSSTCRPFWHEHA